MSQPKISTNAFYKDIVQEYDSLMETSAGYLKEAVRVLNKYQHNNGDLLDVGCGTGLLSQMLHGDIRYTGIEPSAEMSHKARARGYQLLEQPLESSLPSIPDKSYDIVTALGSLLYVEDIQCALDHIRRIARKAFLITLDDLSSDYIDEFVCQVYNHSDINVQGASEDYRLFAWQSPTLDIPVHCRLLYVSLELSESYE